MKGWSDVEEKYSSIELQMQLDEIKRNIKVTHEIMEFQIGVLKKYYDEALKQDFSEEQALKIAIEKS